MSWIIFKVYGDLGSAEVVSEYLRSEGVPARIEPSALGSAVISEYSVLVASGFLHRAKWLMAQSDFNDRELEYLATGKFQDSGAN